MRRRHHSGVRASRLAIALALGASTIIGPVIGIEGVAEPRGSAQASANKLPRATSVLPAVEFVAVPPDPKAPGELPSQFHTAQPVKLTTDLPDDDLRVLLQSEHGVQEVSGGGVPAVLARWAMSSEVILVFLRERVAVLDGPRSVGEALKGSRLGEFWKYRVGDYRIITNIEDGVMRILVLKVGNRREVYR